MKKVFSTVALAAVLLFAAAPAHAIPGFSFGIDGAVNIPTGDWADASGIGLGALGYASFNAIPMLTITGRAGYIHGLEKNNSSMQHIPVLAGIKYHFIPMLYVAGEFGFCFNKQKIDGFGESDWEEDLAATISAGAGLAGLDFRASLFMPDLEHVEDLLGILLTIGYRF